jgi:hypothetical protein
MDADTHKNICEPFFHNQRTREQKRALPIHGLRNHQAARRFLPCVQRARTGHAFPDQSPAGPGTLGDRVDERRFGLVAVVRGTETLLPSGRWRGRRSYT